MIPLHPSVFITVEEDSEGDDEEDVPLNLSSAQVVEKRGGVLDMTLRSTNRRKRDFL